MAIYKQGGRPQREADPAGTLILAIRPPDSTGTSFLAEALAEPHRLCRSAPLPVCLDNSLRHPPR